MEGRNLDITVVSAEYLKKRKRLRNAHTYAVVWVDPYYRQSTTVDKDGGANPFWNQKLSFLVPEHFFQQPNAHLTVQSFRKRSICKDKSIGKAIIPLSEIAQKTNPEEVSTYQLKRGHRCRAKGLLRLSICVGGKTAMAAQAGTGASSVPVAAYPPMYDLNKQDVGAAPYGYPLAGAAAVAPHGYPPAPQYPQAYGGYGGQGCYASAQAGAPPQYYSTQPQRRAGLGGGMGMGLGAGLLAGAVGGLVVGEVIDDAFGGGFDF